ncbi:hypothetical protein TNCV_3159051 [Trichonephila clavipes]|nr:hypothetical protein TNCV_3159051 [Trichonephila clavipes]
MNHKKNGFYIGSQTFNICDTPCSIVIFIAPPYNNNALSSITMNAENRNRTIHWAVQINGATSVPDLVVVVCRVLSEGKERKLPVPETGWTSICTPAVGRGFEHHTSDNTIFLSSDSPQFKGRTPWRSKSSHLSRGLAFRWLFRVPLLRMERGVYDLMTDEHQGFIFSPVALGEDETFRKRKEIIPFDAFKRMRRLCAYGIDNFFVCLHVNSLISVLFNSETLFATSFIADSVY